MRWPNTGASWTDISGNLPSVPVNNLAIDPALTNTYYVATDIGVFWTRNAGSKWSVLSSISGTESPNPVSSGSQLTYNFAVANNGPDPATSAIFTDAVPAGTTFVSANTSVGSCTVPAVGGTGTVSCKLGTLAKGATAALSLVVKDTAASSGVIKDTAKVSSSAPDPVTSNNSVTFNTNVN